MTVKQIYQLQTNDPVEINGIFQQLMQRFDELEASTGTSSGTSTSTSTVTTNASELIYIRDQKAATMDGGTTVANTWHTRDLNTIVNDEDNNCSLSSNRFTLHAGTYRIRVTAPAWQAGNSKLVLYNYTNSAIELVGSSQYSHTSYGYLLLTVQGVITPSSQTTYEIRQWASANKSDDGLGKASSCGEIEIYCEVWLEKTS